MAYNFQRRGCLVVVDSPSEDAVFEAAMEAGADDIVPVVDEEGNPTTSYRVSRRMAGSTWCGKLLLGTTGG